MKKSLPRIRVTPLRKVIDPVKEGIIEKCDAQEIVIRPVQFLFEDQDYTAVFGCLAFDGEFRVYIYPLPYDNWKERPVEFLHAAILAGGSDFKDMMRRAYEQKRPVRIGNHTVEWHEYESLFVRCSFYRPPRPKDEVRIVEDWSKNLPPLNPEDSEPKVDG